MVAAGITAYITTRIQSRSERERWERDFAVKQAERQAAEPGISQAIARRFAVAYLIASDLRSRHYLMPGMTLLVGRDPTNDIVSDYDNISRSAALFSADSNRVILTDLSSTNGIFVNGDRVLGGTTVTLKDKDIVQFASGPFEIEFHSLR